MAANRFHFKLAILLLMAFTIANAHFAGSKNSDKSCKVCNPSGNSVAYVGQSKEKSPKAITGGQC